MERERRFLTIRWDPADRLWSYRCYVRFAITIEMVRFHDSNGAVEDLDGL
jgi:hypothetical protein